MNDGCRAFYEARDLLWNLRDDPAAATAQFRWPVLTEFNWAIDHFDAQARDNHAPALWIVNEDGDEFRASFAEMSARSNRLANFLRSKGVARGDRLLMVLGNEPALWETMLATMKLGAVMIPATTLLTADDIRDRIERGDVRHIVSSAEHAAKFGDAGKECTRLCVGGTVEGWGRFEDYADFPAEFVPDAPTQADDPLLIYFTSGTTSKPKLVLHNHQSYPVGHLSTMYWIGLKPGDIHLNIASPGWAKHAWSSFFAPWNAGACILVHNMSRFDPLALLQVLERCRATSLCAPATAWRRLIQEDLAAWRQRLSIRELVGAGEPLNPEVIAQIKAAWGLTLRDGYGQTETTAQIGNSPALPMKAGSMGLPLPGYRIVLLDADEKEADEGEICVDLNQRPTGLMVSYLDAEGTSADAMRNGYYHTGDTAFRDDDGYLTFVGRADDVFKSSDYRISPFELESILLEHEAVAEAAVVPRPDDMRLTIPKAYLILAPGVADSRDTAEAIFNFIRAKTAPYKRVRVVEFVPDLPKTISGKIRRVELRAREVRRCAGKEQGENEYFESEFDFKDGRS